MKRIAFLCLVAATLYAVGSTSGQDQAIPIDKVNYAEHIAPIINKHCLECHRPGEVAPFSLVGYEQARKWAPMLAITTTNGVMPPWKAVHGFGEFDGENRLTKAQIETLKNWDRAEAPRGDPKKEPAAPVFSSEWPFGEPDLVVSQSKPFVVSAEGADVYRNFVIPTNFKETKFVKTMAVKPGNTRIVHHVIAYVDDHGVADKLQQKTKDGLEGYSSFGSPGFIPDTSYGGWAPGSRAVMLPPGAAFELKPGARIVMQIHYHKTGKEETDQTRLGLYFAKEPIKNVVELAWLANLFLRIPANAENHKVEATFPFSKNVTMYGVMPHMHLLGKSMKATLILPNGEKKPLVFVDKWSFDWQLTYTFKTPLKVPAGSKVHVEAYYDNSAENTNNPNDPPKVVTWGEETTDEMFLLVASYSVDHD